MKKDFEVIGYKELYNINIIIIVILNKFQTGLKYK